MISLRNKNKKMDAEDERQGASVTADQPGEGEDAAEEFSREGEEEGQLNFASGEVEEEEEKERPHEEVGGENEAAGETTSDLVAARDKGEGSEREGGEGSPSITIAPRTPVLEHDPLRALSRSRRQLEPDEYQPLPVPTTLITPAISPAEPAAAAATDGPSTSAAVYGLLFTPGCGHWLTQACYVVR
jgi:hypothetical protein